MQYRYLHMSIGGDALVNLGAITSEITFLFVYLCMVIEQKSAYHLHSSLWHFKRIGRLKCQWARAKRRWMCTSHINLVGFDQSSTYAVNAAQLGTAGIDRHLG